MTREKQAAIQPDRRSARRYGIEQVLYYKRCAKGAQCQRGLTVDISSGAVRFTTGSHPLRPGEMVELSVNWPAFLGGCPLKLQILGYVVRSGSDSAVVKIVRHEFRTRRDPAEVPAAITGHAQGTGASFGRRSWLNGAPG